MNTEQSATHSNVGRFAASPSELGRWALGVLCSALMGVFVTTLQAEMTPEEAANTVILNEVGVKNLRIETVEAEEIDFEETVFALGRIGAIPERRAVVASRIPGRIVELRATHGTMVEAGADVARLESRQPGDPPPSIWLKTPAGGLITESVARIGEPVDPDKVLLEITDLSEVYAIARVPEHLAGKLKPGAVTHIAVAALSEEKFDGTLLRFGTAADKSSGTIDAIFSLPNPGLTLRPGMRAEFSIVLSKREGVMSIPRIALQGEATNRTVYRRHYDPLLKHTFVRVPVQIGAMNDRFVEVTGGLTPGDEVVTTGAYSLAFAGKGSVSLKAALDAAHGHEHNEDGTEMTAEQKAARAKGGDTHAHGAGFSKLAAFSLASNALLLVLLAVAMMRKPRAEEAPAAPASKTGTH
jgi:membrane fusion protein, heavy metal efflux system